ncbi:MAG: M1 family metallopeptidase [Candidatus Aminicenantes bacterium]|nr:M1 family metallopeptidase [Candidatus Aminicenantes bacterium]
MKKAFKGNRISALGVLLAFFAAAAQSVMANADPPPGPEPIVEYAIDARLLPANRSLEATQVLTWRNPTQIAAKTLRFHLYYNAFRGPESTFMRERGLQRFKSRRQDKARRYGGIDILELSRIGGNELTEKIAFIAPDDQNEKDRTVIEIPLDIPVAPGESIRLRFRFQLKIPEIFARTGCWKNFFFMGQWFPKIGVFQDDGTWHCHQFHANSEFFADFGRYRVAVTLPAEYVVGATGNPVSNINNADGTVTHTFAQDRVHDFAWTAWPEFLQLRRQAVVPGRDRPVEVVLLLDPQHENARERYFQSVIFAMRFMSEKLFPYPYDRITVVDPPLGAAGAMGMEYPTLITGGHISFLPEGIHFTEMVTIHEFGHQYWYGLVASDEFREAWLDEGVNTFFEGEIMEAYFKKAPSLLDWFGIRIRDTESRRGPLKRIPVLEPVNQPSWHFLSGSNYSSHVYNRAAVFIDTLKGYLGKEKLYDFFARYARQYAWKHPSTHDFIAALNEVAGQDLAWAFKQFINGTGRLDLAVHSLSSQRMENDPASYRNEVLLVRREGFFPADVLIRLRNGREVRHLWKDPGRWKRLEFTHESPLHSVVIDPEFRIPLDHDLVNNSMAAQPSRKESQRAALKLGFLFQTLLGMLFM